MSTYVSPWGDVDDATVVMAVSHENPLPVVNLVRHQLHYPAMPPDASTALALIEQQYSGCGLCHLANNRDNVVFFRGNPYSPVVAIGEGPGKTENSRGKPFVGASGRLQSELFRECGIDPDQDIGWINLVGCRPCIHRFAPDRPPTEAELMACSERFLCLLRALRPRVVLMLGDHAANAFFDSKAMHPNTWHVRGRVYFGYTRHPAYLLRAIPAANSYKEYMAAKLFLESLKSLMDQGLEKVPEWEILPRYLEDPQPAVGGSL